MVLRELQSRTELNIGALFAGKYVDIDVDNDNGMLHQALDHFLPETPWVWGRASKRRSHRVYALHDDFDRGPWSNTLRYIKGLRGPDPDKKEKIGSIDEYSYSVELRGGKPENGLFSVLPGSVHPSGEAVEWDAAVDPTMSGVYVETERLVRALRLSVVAAIVARHWVSGTRNDLSLALAGTLWRIRTASMAAFGLENDEATPEGYYVLDEPDAEALFRCIMKLAGDNHDDERSRLLNLKNTWRKLDSEAGSKVTGGKVLAELIGAEVGPRVVKALYRLLSDNDSAEQLEALAERYVMWYGPGVIVDLDMVAGSRDNPWMTKFQAEASLGGKNMIIADKKIPIAKMLFGSGIINRIVGLTFDPSQNDLIVQGPHGLLVNQWRGFAIEPCDQRIEFDQIKMFHDYVLEVIADGNKDYAHWVFSWLADILQNPHKKPGTALVLVGVEGAGKTFLGEHILGKIIGSVHATQTNSVSTLTNQFNTIIDNKIFLVCNEAIHSYQKDVASRLKSLITDETIVIEPKGINSYTKPNHMHMMFTSNEEASAIFISASPYERRFTVLKVSDHRARDIRYWDDMHLWTPANLHRIMRWLMDYRYDRKLIMRPLETEAKRVIQKVGVDQEVAWILQRISEGFPLSVHTHQFWFEAYNSETMLPTEQQAGTLRRDAWPDLVVPSSLENDYRSYVRSMGKPVHSGSVITNIRRVMPSNALGLVRQTSVHYIDPKRGNIVRTRVRMAAMPSVDDILTHLKKRYGGIIDDILAETAETKEIVIGIMAKHDREEY